MSSAMLASRANADTRAILHGRADGERGGGDGLRFLREAKDRGPGGAPIATLGPLRRTQAPPLGPRLVISQPAD